MAEEVKTPTDQVLPVISDRSASLRDSIDLTTADLASLKAAFDLAVEERANVDSWIEELRKAIKARLAEFQKLNDRVSNAQSSQPHTIKLPSVSIGAIGGFVTRYVIPAVVIFILLWFGVKLIRQRYVNTEPSQASVELRMPVTNEETVSSEQRGVLWS